MLGKVHKVNHFYVFVVANPVAMLDIVLTIPRGDKTISLKGEMEKHYLRNHGMIRSQM
jgi:hypothetical protein